MAAPNKTPDPEVITAAPVIVEALLSQIVTKRIGGKDGNVGNQATIHFEVDEDQYDKLKPHIGKEIDVAISFQAGLGI